MVLINTHPDYMRFTSAAGTVENYNVKFYIRLLDYLKTKYRGQYWHVLPKEIARYWRDHYCNS